MLVTFFYYFDINKHMKICDRVEDYGFSAARLSVGGHLSKNF